MGQRELENLKAERRIRRKLPKEGEGNRYVFVPVARCPACDSTDLQTYRSTRDGETISRHTKCRTCEQRFIVVAE
jgi:hypothetical protein